MANFRKTMKKQENHEQTSCSTKRCFQQWRVFMQLHSLCFFLNSDDHLGNATVHSIHRGAAKLLQHMRSSFAFSDYQWLMLDDFDLFWCIDRIFPKNVAKDGNRICKWSSKAKPFQIHVYIISLSTKNQTPTQYRIVTPRINNEDHWGVTGVVVFNYVWFILIPSF